LSGLNFGADVMDVAEEPLDVFAFSKSIFGSLGACIKFP
jgi:hypothetical protein